MPWPATGSEQDGRVVIQFTTDRLVSCMLDEVSRYPPPPLPGGYTVGEKLYFLGTKRQKFECGNRIVHGEQGEVAGAADEPRESPGCRSSSRTTRAASIARSDTLSRSSPLPRGYTLGEKLYFLGPSQTFECGDGLVHSEQGELIGLGDKDGHFWMQFPKNKDCVNVPFEEPLKLSAATAAGRLQSWREALLHRTESDVQNGDRLMHGEQGELMGPSHQEGCLSMSFPGHKLNTSSMLTFCHARRRVLKTRSTTSASRTAFNGWCDVHDRAFITKREAKAAKAAKQEAAKRKAEKKARRKQGLAQKYAEADASRAAEEAAGPSGASKRADDVVVPVMTEEERERDAQRRERARKAREERARRPRWRRRRQRRRPRARVDGDGRIQHAAADAVRPAQAGGARARGLRVGAGAPGACGGGCAEAARRGGRGGKEARAKEGQGGATEAASDRRGAGGARAGRGAGATDAWRVHRPEHAR